VSVEAINPVESEDPHEELQEIYTSYTTQSTIFQGTCILIMISYFEAAVYIIVDNPKGFLKPFLNLAQTVAFIGPILQILWNLSTVLVAKIPYSYRWTSSYVRLVS
jgi:hypothetical protein